MKEKQSLYLDSAHISKFIFVFLSVIIVAVDRFTISFLLNLEIIYSIFLNWSYQSNQYITLVLSAISSNYPFTRPLIFCAYIYYLSLLFLFHFPRLYSLLSTLPLIIYNYLSIMSKRPVVAQLDMRLCQVSPLYLPL